jgi:MarR family transcriptional regulator, organic hydroperoxide resistance regulator
MGIVTRATASGGVRPAVPRTDGLLIVELQRATHAAGVRLEELLADVGVSQGEAHVLALLADGSPQTVGELQQGLGHRPSTLSGILDRLESKRLIRRSLNDADRRSLLISLTRTGRGAAEAVTVALRSVEREMLASVTARDRAGFRAVTRNLHA